MLAGIIAGIMSVTKNHPCDIIDCGGNGSCVDGYCNCDFGYVSENNFCYETCAVNPCQELNLRLRSIQVVVYKTK